MNILFLSSLYPPETKGGGELSTHYLAQGLAARGHQVKVITTGKSHVESHVNGVDVIRAPLPLLAKPLFEKRHSHRIAHQLRKLIGNPARYDIIHAHDFRTALALHHLQLPNMIVTARDYAQISGCTNNILGNGSINPGCAEHPFGCHRVAEASLIRKPFRLWQYIYNQSYRKHAFASFPKQIFISHAQEKEIRKYQQLDNQKTAVIYNPILPDFLTALPNQTTTNTVLYVGRIEMYKGVKVLLEAWRIVAKENPNLHLVIVGEGAQRQEYEHLVGKWGLQYRVSFKGKIAADRMKSVYDASDIVVAPHLWVEPFGRTTVEAMARGKTIIAAACGGSVELVQDKVTGFLVPRNSPEELARTIVEANAMSHYDKRAMHEAARAWVQKHLTSDIIAKEHEEFYAA